MTRNTTHVIHQTSTLETTITAFLGSIRLIASRPAPPKPSPNPPPEPSSTLDSRRTPSRKRSTRRARCLSLIAPPSRLNLAQLPGQTTIEDAVIVKHPKKVFFEIVDPSDYARDSTSRPSLVQKDTGDVPGPVTQSQPAVPSSPAPVLTQPSPPSTPPTPIAPITIATPDPPPSPTPSHRARPTHPRRKKPKHAHAPTEPPTLYKKVLLNRFGKTTHGQEILYRGAQRGIQYLLDEESKALRRSIREREEREKVKEEFRRQRTPSLLRRPCKSFTSIGVSVSVSVTHTADVSPTPEAHHTHVKEARGNTITRAKSWAHFPRTHDTPSERVSGEVQITTGYSVRFWNWDR